MTDQRPITPPPPVGLRPRWIADEHRLNEVDAALERYRQAGIEPPEEWLDERRDIEDRLLRHHPCAAALAQPEPQGPTDEELDGLFDAHCYTDDFGTHLMDAACFRDGARALLAQPEPQGPTDAELKAAYWEAFKNAAPCGADQSWLAGLRAVALWDRSVIEPDGPAVLGSREPASVTDQSTDEELDEFAIYWWGSETDERSVSDVIECGSMAAYARAALSRYGRPAIEPVP